MRFPVEVTLAEAEALKALGEKKAEIETRMAAVCKEIGLRHSYCAGATAYETKPGGKNGVILEFEVPDPAPGEPRSLAHDHPPRLADRLIVSKLRDDLPPPGST